MGVCSMQKMYISLHSVIASRLGFFLIGILSFTLLLIQWQFHTFTSLLRQDLMLKDLPVSRSDPTDLVIEKFKVDQETNKKMIQSLNHQITDLQKILKTKMEQLEKMEKMQKGDFSVNDLSLVGVYPDADKIAHYIKNQVDSAFVTKPHPYKNEYDIFPFSLFTGSSVYKLDQELLRQPEKSLSLHADRSKDLKEVIEAGRKILNDGDSDKHYEFVEGLYRMQYQAGMQYDLTFRSKINHSSPLQLVTLFRPFAPIHLVSKDLASAIETVHVIVPLSGRGDAFRKFMESFKHVAIQGDGHVHLTVVCYGDEAKSEAKQILEQVESETNFHAFQVVEGQSGTFARGRALQEGSIALQGGNPLMFFCDVDMYFTTQFLSQCRSHTKPGNQVFYPVVFSLYNPEIVYENKPIPSKAAQQVIKKDNGFWRDFGFGMTCQYKKDFNDIGGFDLTIKGWGSEDVLLYRKYTRSSKYQIVRTPVNTLFHHWHPKHCDKSLSLDQYNACLRTKSLTEGSQIQLGMLYLKDKDDG